jgi:hypothetical protein
MSDRKHVMLLHGGGVRSLVATASVLHRAEPARLTLLHVLDGRAAAVARLEHVRRQADHYGLRHLQELPAESLYHRPTDQLPDGRPQATLATPRMLLQALAYAADHGADELLWPIAVDTRPGETAAAQERMILCRQLLGAEPRTGTGAWPDLTLPLLSFSDRQVIELGAGLGVPWDTAWSCVYDDEPPCGSCPTCRRRRAAFRAAAVTDPVFAVGAGRG